MLPLPVSVNRFSKNLYHSRDISPVRSSIMGTRGGGILVMFGGLGTGRARKQFGGSNENPDRIGA